MGKSLINYIPTHRKQIDTGYFDKMKVETQSSEQVSKEFLDFVQRVSKREQLDDWKLIIWALKGEAECIIDMKLIYMPSDDDIEKMKAWFLHEVSHATFDTGGGSFEDSIWHKKSWRTEFDRLLKYYIPNITPKTFLWLKVLE